MVSVPLDTDGKSHIYCQHIAGGGERGPNVAVDKEWIECKVEHHLIAQEKDDDSLLG